MVCSNCGSPILDSFKYCPICAAEIIRSEEAKEEKKKAKKSMLLYFLMLQLGLPFLFMWGYAAFNIKMDENAFFMLCFEIALVVITILVAYVNREVLIADFKKLTIKEVGYGVLTWLSIFAVSIIAVSIVSIFNPVEKSENQLMVEDGFKQFLILCSITTMILAPICEELIFRKNLKAFFRNDKAFIIASALLFGAVHTFDIINGIQYYLMGACFAIAYVKTKSIYVPIIGHMMQNILATIVIITTVL